MEMLLCRLLVSSDVKKYDSVLNLFGEEASASSPAPILPFSFGEIMSNFQAGRYTSQTSLQGFLDRGPCSGQ